MFRDTILFARRQPLASVLLLVTTVLAAVVVTLGLYTHLEVSRIENVLSRDIPVVFYWRAQGAGLDDATLPSLVGQSPNLRRISPWVASVQYAIPLSPEGKPVSTESAWRITSYWVYPEAVEIAQLEMVAGQPMSEVDWRNQAKVALLSTRVAAALFGGENSPAAWVGRQFLLSDGPAPSVRVYPETDPAAGETERQRKTTEEKAEAPAGVASSQVYTVIGVFDASPELAWAGAVPMMLLPSSVAPAALFATGTSTASGSPATRRVVPAGIAKPAASRTDEAIRDLEVLLNGPPTRSGFARAASFSVEKEPIRARALEVLRRNAAQARLQILLSMVVALASQFAVVWSVLTRRIWEFGLRRCLGMRRGRLVLGTAIEVTLLCLPAFIVVIPVAWFILNHLVRPSILTLVIGDIPVVPPASLGTMLTAAVAAAGGVLLLVWAIALAATYEASRLPPGLALSESP